MAWQSGSSTEEKIWYYLIEETGCTKAGAAGIMGNMKNESGMIPNRVQMGYGWTDSGYTSAVDSGSYRNFVYDSIGYGLVQYTYYTLKQKVYNLAKSKNKSVGDLEVQLEALKNMLQQDYTGLYAILKSSNDVRQCCVSFLLQYEKPADQSAYVQNLRTQSAQQFYDQFNGLATSGPSSGYDSSGTVQTTIKMSYDREKDPLVLEFGYASESSSSANMGKSMKADRAGKYPVSAVNMSDLMNDMFDIWGFNTATDGSASSSGTQVAGRAKMKSGRVVTSGTLKEIPSSVSQTGLIASYTGYIRNWTSGTTQRTIYDLWNQAGKPTSNTICTLDGYYLIAPGRYFSNSCGDILEVQLENGTKFMCMVADTKGADTQNEYGHMYSGSVDIIEWESTGTSVQQVQQGLRTWGVYGIKVKNMINYGSWFS